MNALTKITLTLGFAGIAWLWLAPQPEESNKPLIARRQSAPVLMPTLPPTSKSEPLLPPPVLGESAPAGTSTTAAPVAVLNWQPVPAAGAIPWGRPAEESMMSTWAARDPEGAGRWLNQNRQHPKFADMVRGYEDIKERNIALYLDAARAQAAKLGVAWPADDAFDTNVPANVTLKTT